MYTSRCGARRHLGPCLLVLLAWAGVSFALDVSSEAGRLLRRPDVGLSARDLADAGGGDVIAHSLPSSEDGEVAVVGLVRVDVPPDFFVSRVRDIESFKRSRRVFEVGRFSAPPRVEDLDALTVPADDLRDLRSCRVGDCDLQLTEGAIERFRTAIDWSSAGAERSADALFRGLLVEQATAYLDRGVRALPEYQDKREPVSVSRRMQQVLDASPYMRAHAPEIHAYLAGFGGGTPDQVDEFLYWSKEDLDLKPIVSLTHVVIRPWTAPGVTGYWVASRQIYATHYLSGSLGLTGFVEVQEQDGSRARYLIYLNRTRTESLGGFLGPLKRAIAGRRARGGMQETLTYTRARLEGAYRQEQAGRPER